MLETGASGMNEQGLVAEGSGQEHWSGLPCPPPGDLPNPRIKPVSSALAGIFFTAEPLGKPRKG